jgi:hypothetical protein
MDTELNNATKFKHELGNLINKYSKENGSDTPDFILAEYLVGCLNTFNVACNMRTKWYKPLEDIESNG